MKKYLFLLISLCSCSCENVTDTVQNKATHATVVWSYSIPEQYLDETQPIIENGKVFIASDTTICCRELKSGKQIWSNSVGNSSSIAGQTLPHDDDAIYVYHIGFIKAFRKADGMTLWQTDFNPFKAIDGVMSLHSTSLYMGLRGEAIKVNKHTGQIELTIPLDTLSPNTVVQTAREVALSPSDSRLYVGTGYWAPDAPVSSGNVFCFDAQTGRRLWAYPVPKRLVYGYTTSYADSILVESDRAVKGIGVSGNWVVFTAGHDIIALNRLTGEPVWQAFFPKDAFGAGLTISGDRVYAGSQDRTVYCLDLNTGAVLWQTPLSSGSIMDILTVKDGRVYFAVSLGGGIFVLDANNGRLIWNGQPPEYARDDYYIYASNIAVGEGYMVNVGSRKVYCLTVP